MKTSRFYDLLSPLYFLIDANLKTHKKKLVREVNQYSRAKVLEIGIGHGKHLKNYIQADITGIDASSKMLGFAKKYNSNKIKFFLLDAVELASLNQKFDLIILSHVLSTSKQPNKILNEAIKCLTTNGKLIILNHFSNNRRTIPFEKAFSPIAKTFHFQSYFPPKKLTSLTKLKQLKARKFGFLNSYQLLVFTNSK